MVAALEIVVRQHFTVFFANHSHGARALCLTNSPADLTSTVCSYNGVIVRFIPVEVHLLQGWATSDNRPKFMHFVSSQTVNRRNSQEVEDNAERIAR